MLSQQSKNIQQIRNDFYHASERLKVSLNNSIQTLADDLYNKHTHFIFELIQNAEDNTYKECVPYLSFRLTKNDPTNSEGSKGALIIQNNEIGFSYDNVDAICAVGKTTKKKEQGYIGEKGIGFKSVFRVTDNPHIFSNGYHFCLPERDKQTGLGYIVPQWIDTLPEELNFSQTHIILPLTKADFGYEKIENMLRDIEPESILFLSTLQEIRIKTDSGDDFTILKDDSAMPEVTVLVEGNRQGSSFSSVNDFLVCTETFDKPADIHHEKRDGIEDREVSVAFPLGENSTGIGKIFAYLPVRSDTGFPFLINADFILPSSREDIQDVPWNHWLMDCVATVVASKLLPLLKEKNLLTVPFLEKLANKLQEYWFCVVDTVAYKHDLFCPIFTRVCETLMNKELLPANDGTFVSALNAKLARGDAIRNLLNHNQLGTLFSQSNDAVKWLSSEITQDRTPNLRQYLMDLEVEDFEVTPDTFARRLSKSFLFIQSDEWFIKFYKFLSAQPALWRFPRSVLRTKPILRLQDREHVNPFREDNSPNAYLPIGWDTDTSFPIVKIELSEDEEALKFLMDLGIQKWDIVEEVIRYVLPKYRSDSLTVPIEDYKNDFAKIEHAYKTDSKEKRDRLRQALLEIPFILIESSDMGIPIYRSLDQVYFPTDELRLYFEGNDSCAFVNLDEYSSSARELFQDLGVTDSVRVERQERNFQNHIVIYSRHGQHVRGLNGFDYNISVDGLEHALNNPTPLKSAFIWNRIAIPNADCIKGIVEKATRQDYSNRTLEQRTSNSFGGLLIKTMWLPDSEGNMHKPEDMGLDDLPESFHRDEELANQLNMKKDVVAQLAEETGVPVEFINQLMNNPEEYKEFMAWKAQKTNDYLDRKDSDIKLKPVQEHGSTNQEEQDTNGEKGKPFFPVAHVANPERWEIRFNEELENAPDKESNHRLRSVRENTETIEFARTWLKVNYTNDDEQMICQICQEEMPFKKRDGEYYFEAVEAFTKEYLTKEHETQFLALCPECAARYKEFVKLDEDEMGNLINQLMDSDSPKVPLQLGELSINLRFVDRHWLAIKQILTKLSEDT